MKKIITGIAVILLMALAFTACQKDNTGPENKITDTQLTPQQISKRKNLKETAIILARMVNDKKINKEIFDQIRLNKRGFHRVIFSKLMKENTFKSEPNNDFRAVFIQEAKKVLGKTGLKSDDENSDTIMTVNELITYLEQNNINVYWPYSQNWNGTEIPTVTYQPFDNFDENEGFVSSGGSQFKSTEADNLKTVKVDDDYAWQHPTLIVDTSSNAYLYYKEDTASTGSGSSTTNSGNDGNYDVNKVFIHQIRTNGKNFRGLFGGENQIMFYRAGEELVNTTLPEHGQVLAIDRWAGRKGVWRTKDQVWDYNWKPGEIQQWIGVKLLRVKRESKTTFSGDISLKVNSSNTVATKSSSTSGGGFGIKLFGWQVEISYKDLMGKDATWDRKQFFYENWSDADGYGMQDGLCVRLAGDPGPHTRGGVFFTMSVKSYNY